MIDLSPTEEPETIKLERWNLDSSISTLKHSRKMIFQKTTSKGLKRGTRLKQLCFQTFFNADVSKDTSPFAIFSSRVTWCKFCKLIG